MTEKQAFSGIKVLAVARVVAAPFAAYQLAMHGADVITIESPDSPDESRVSGDFGTDFHRQGMARVFLALNANKRSMTLRIDTPEGQEVFRRMASGVDVVIENLKGGTMARYGIGYEDLRKFNPRIIFASVTGFGQTGPKKSDPAIDGVIQALSGLMSITGTPETGPLKTGSTIVDYTTGYATAFAIATALFQRTQTGAGQWIDATLLETAMTLMSGESVRAISGGGQPPLVGNGNSRGLYISNTYPCKTGYLSVAAGASPRRERFWKAIDREDIPQDPRFSTDQAARANLKELEAEVIRTLSGKTAVEWEEILNKNGVPAMRVRDLTDAVHQEQLQHRQFFHRFATDSGTGLPEFAVPTSSYRMSANPVRISAPPPRLGQHTDEVLKEFGYSAEEIARLRDCKAV